MRDYRIWHRNASNWVVQEPVRFWVFTFWKDVKTFKTLKEAHCFAFPYDVNTAVYMYCT